MAVVGAGVIGASWSTLFLAKGLDVIATDPAPGAEQALRDYVAHAWLAMESSGRRGAGRIDGAPVLHGQNRRHRVG